ncbi:MAG: DUF58 domain-containing protein [Proteobacteria bacterium]|jgi:hypothetical protein|nr:DUF58 domain-containing protein [Alphaproteobacteria bacterium]NCC02610.1 DUF58 domain-containing protein [Pseudomonadota bacterium]
MAEKQALKRDQRLINEAMQIAECLRFSPETRQRTSRTEKVWQYRKYQGGEPASRIDWKQSARGREIIVREHEQIFVKKIYLWANMAPLDEALHHRVALLMYSFAYLLTYRERSVGWLGDDLPLTNTTAQIPILFEKGFREQSEVPKSYNVNGALMIFFGNFLDISPMFSSVVRTYGGQGNQGVLVHLGRIESRFHHGWPIIGFDPESGVAGFIPVLLKLTLDATK